MDREKHIGNFSPSYPQKGLFYAHFITPEAPVLNIAGYVELHKSYDLRLLKKSVELLLKHTPFSAMQFVSSQGDTPQIQLFTGQSSLLEKELEVLKVQNKKNLLHQLKKDSERPFNIFQAPFRSETLAYFWIFWG